MVDRSFAVKSYIAFLLIGILMIAFILGGFLLDREKAREEGHAHGYTTGYSIGYADALAGRRQNDQKLAGEIVPYDVGTGRWKYFIMGFAEGYEAAQSGENLWYTNES